MSHITIPRLIAVLVVVSAILVPAASARPVDSIGIAPIGHAQTDIATPVVIEPTSNDASAASGGFDWGDAALGAVGTLVVLSAGAAGVVAVRRSRGRSQTVVAG